MGDTFKQNHLRRKKMNNQARKHEYEITPDVSLLKKMACISGTVSNRIMELVDNSIDAKVEGKPLLIDVNIVKKGTKQYIEVIDNGTGMDEFTARNYLKLGKSDKAGQSKIGRFGLGAKVAVLGLGDACQVYTTPIEQPYAVEINFNIHKFQDWKIQYQVKEEKKPSHGTKVRITNLTIRLGDIQKFSERLSQHLSKTYKHFLLKEDVVIRINGTKVKPAVVELLDDFYQEFDFEIDGKRVYGWAGAMKEAGTNWKFGFELINNGRIIKSNDLLNRQAHTSLARLVGEIHLDDFETDIHKTDFMRETEAFQSMQERLLEKELTSLISKISKLTNGEVFEKYQTDLGQVSKTLNKVLRSYDFLSNLDIEEGVFKQLKKKIKAKKEKVLEKEVPKEVEEELDEILEFIAEMEEKFCKEEEPEEEKPKKERKPRTNSGLIINDPVGISLGESEIPRRWSIFEQENSVTINIEVNLDHPSYQQLEEEESVRVLMKNAVLDSVAEFILQEEKKQSGFMEEEVDRLNRIKDMLIRHSLLVG